MLERAEETDEKTGTGDIHEKRFRPFWRALNPGVWVEKLLEEGYRIPFWDEVPEVYREENNASAKRNMDFVQMQIQKLVDRGVVERRQETPRCVNPLTVAAKTLENGDQKLRLCLDLSRHVNPKIKNEPAKLTTFRSAISLILPGDFQGVYDLPSAYHHVRMHPESTEFLGFNVPWEGEDRFYVFVRLPFGLSTAGQVLDRVLKPVCAKIAAQGIRHSIYIDDGHISAESKEKAAFALRKVYEALEGTGFKLAKEKSDTEESVSQIKEYLGFKVDAKEMRVYAPGRKMSEIKRLIAEEKTHAGTWRKVKALAALAGKIIAIEAAIGPVAQLLTRALQQDIVTAVDLAGWHTKTKLSKQSQEALELLMEVLDDMNGHGIKSEATAVPLQAFIRSAVTVDKEVCVHVPEVHSIIAGDASDVAVCSYAVNGEPTFNIREALPESYRKLSSGHRELMTVLLTLRQEGARMKEARGGRLRPSCGLQTPPI